MLRDFWRKWPAAKWSWAHPVRKRLAVLRNWVADWGINYIEKAFEKELFAKYGKPHRRSFDGGVDVMVNFTGGDTWVPSLKALKRGGKLLDLRCDCRLRSENGYPVYLDF